jgi:exodeoxyribonuclease VII large subunit
MEDIIFTVTQLNRQVKGFLENEIGPILVEGEVSNLSKPSSGHCYFTLKDQQAQIRCAFFKNRQSPQEMLKEGQQVVVNGRLSLYEARGDYQLIVSQFKEAGLGALYQQFEALKNRLKQEGLFDEARKKVIPRMPRSIGLITSPTGAAIRDILSTLARRFPLAHVFVYPVEVQGNTAAGQMIQALKQANKEAKCEVLILARGGGSIEDLWAFNHEQLARQIANSTIPIVSGVGHETDFTIADFVADYRAATPTAAAEAVSVNAADLLQFVIQSRSRLQAALQQRLQYWQFLLKYCMDKLSSPQRAIAASAQKLDYLERQLLTQIASLQLQNNHQLNHIRARLEAKNPGIQLMQAQLQFKQLWQDLIKTMQAQLEQARLRLTAQLSTLHAVSPLATLDRGYAIASHAGKVLFSSEDVQPNDEIALRLAKGTLHCLVLAS